MSEELNILVSLLMIVIGVFGIGSAITMYFVKTEKGLKRTLYVLGFSMGLVVITWIITSFLYFFQII